MKVSSRGRAIFAITIALGFSLVLFAGNPFILFAFLIFLGVLVGEVVWLAIILRRPSNWFEISAVQNGENPVASKRLKPGEIVEESFNFKKKGEGALTLSSGNQFLKLHPPTLSNAQRTSEIIMTFTTPFAGRYSMKDLIVGVTSPLGLFTGKCALPFPIQYLVTPRVVDVAIIASKLLGKGGIGETPTDRPGIGTEFYDMRDYQAGDDFRQVNWKATARQGSLVVNDHMREVGSSYYLVLEAYSPDYFDTDRLASAFLQIANSLTIAGVRFGILVYDGEKVQALKKIDAPVKSLIYALEVALSFADVQEEDLALSTDMELIPVSSRVLKRNAMTLRKTLSEVELAGRTQQQKMLQRQNEGPFTLLALVRQSAEDERPAVIYVTGLFSGNSLSSVVELGDNLRREYAADFVVANPTAPWVVAASEEDAYAEYQKYLSKLKTLRHADIEYSVGEPIALVDRIFSSH